MNTKNNALMRSIWGEQMAKDGFIWKYRVWIRIDFEKEWYAAIVPRSVGQGYCVDIGYDVDLLDSLTPEILRQRLHHYACPSAFELCRYLDHHPQGVQMNLVSEETFREQLDEYISYARPLLFQIRSAADAVRFMIDYHWHGKPNCYVCEHYIHLLMYLGCTDDASHVIGLMRQSARSLIDFDKASISMYQKMIEPEHVYSWETAKDRNRKIKTANEEIAINKQRIKNHNDALSRADQLDDVIRSGRYDPIVEDIRSRIKENTGLLEAMFTKKEKAVMRGESADQNGRQ